MKIIIWHSARITWQCSRLYAIYWQSARLYVVYALVDRVRLEPMTQDVRLHQVDFTVLFPEGTNLSDLETIAD